MAWKLFLTNGYEATSINNIIDAAGISKGAMYHYFKSKEEILDAVLRHKIEEELKMMETVVGDPALPATDKLIWLLLRRNNEDSKQTEEMIRREHDSLLDYRLKELNRQAVIPIITRIIDQGITEGGFSTEYPEEMAIFGYYIFTDLLFRIVLHQETVDIDRSLKAVWVFMQQCLNVKSAVINHWDTLLKAHYSERRLNQ